MTLIEKLMETQEFATLPPVASRVLNLLEDENVEIRKLAEIIETDASLTLKLLRVANSPLYATRNEVSSIQQAIITLGLNRLTNIVLGVSIFSKFLLSSKRQISKLMEKFWWHSSCAGMVAKAFTKKIKKNFKEAEFIGGLLHDFGKLAMLQYDAVKYQEVISLVEEKGAGDMEAEMDVFGVTHVEVGTEIANLWKLPYELSTIIAYHMNPKEAPDFNDLTAAVRLADMLVEIWGAGFYEGLTKIAIKDSDAWELISHIHPELQDVDVEVITFELEEDFKKSSDFLSIISKQ